jgi:hypothetical protein
MNIAELLGSKPQPVLPMTRIVDEVNFREKGDAFLLQLADACAFPAQWLGAQAGLPGVLRCLHE